MKHLLILTTLLLTLRPTPHAADAATPAVPKPKDPAFIPITNDPKLPRVRHKIVARLRKTGAKLIFATTTPVPECEAGKYVKDSELPYNEVARKVMAEEGIVVNDLWAAVKPQRDKLQIPRNVHFHAAGSAVLAKQVAQSIRAALPKPPPESRP